MEAVIFDLDGTLWDATETTFQSWKHVMDSHKNVTTPLTKELLKSYMGLQLDEIARRHMGYIEEAERLKIIEECSDYQNVILEKQGAILYPNLESTLKKLHEKVKLFVVSNCGNGYIEAFIKAHGFEDYFDDFECPGRTGLSKAKNIRVVMERNNIKNAVYLGDTQKDADSAEEAEIPFIYARYGFGEVKNYKYYIDEFQQLLKYFD
ncbi:HAD family hydrolase [Clostridium sp. 19966]|nr:HAD family hydrolase [Clostridium sp. 19966]